MGNETQFRAIVVDRTENDEGKKVQSAALRVVDDAFLMDGDVTIAVDYSSINFKDGLALTGRPGVVRVWPLIAGIDLVGRVLHSEDPRWQAGDQVILNGAGLSETHHGGLAERARVSGDSLVRRPEGISARRAAAIGTAGFTAMLSVLALERGGITPDSGDILVTGAGGGVGSVAVALLSHRGYRVTASTGRIDELGDYLRGLGAAELVDRRTLSEPGKPLQPQRWAGAIDSVGSTTLANVLAQTNYGGVVTSCGLAQGADLPATVMPFILRAVSLVGVNSVEAPLPQRQQAWRRLATDLDLELLDSLTEVVPLDAAFDAGARILAGTLHGRTVVDVRR
ncbi:oxidoreductase [Cryobacterium sp. TMT1-21]|uniref:acrylyl-CoA reductase (NADPH) n=1 Tax=unclassified Cryobacterium TaxID=2649013 RepID=UPI00106B7AD0|nr:MULTISPECIES: MDR family oxidoreductase [unclassified Cryobacterium]TFC85053.1 oxidoreductase [Cryobacterium sp. TmT2-59]TFD13906.1 oxidoreductase [Cryobacterium sp. TMT1-21]TFD20065.1 oxidoreductase [Cryobacterium sp. TMT4-10]TFD21921.1 oxidoreductase [Cryobacterium sp. TMT2-23]TFD37415.1 oxidoreductase [Cryobacterium sp. TMT2-10]